MAIAEDIERVVFAISSHRFRFFDEADLQDGLALVLKDAGIPFEREVAFTARDRIDFMIGRIGLEVKVAGSLSEVTRQLHRYAASPTIDALILVTRRAAHKYLPPTLHDKPVHVIHLLTSAL